MASESKRLNLGILNQIEQQLNSLANPDGSAPEIFEKKQKEKLQSTLLAMTQEFLLPPKISEMDKAIMNRIAQNLPSLVREKYDNNDLGLRLRQAAASQDLGEVNLLLHKHPELINSCSSSNGTMNTALHLAVQKKDVLMIYLLCGRYKAFTQLKNKAGKTPVDLAIDSGDKETLATLKPFYLSAATLVKRLTNLFNLMKLSQNLPSGTFSVLSLACGIFFELPALNRYFLTTEKAPKVFTYVGIDNNFESLNSIPIQKNENTFFEQMDATKAPLLQEFLKNKKLPLKFDFIVLRNPNISAEESSLRETFETIITKIIPLFLKDDGKLFVSCYHKYEFDRILELLQTYCQPCQGMSDFNNCIVSPLDFKDPLDQFACLFERTPTMN